MRANQTPQEAQNLTHDVHFFDKHKVLSPATKVPEENLNKTLRVHEYIWGQTGNNSAKFKESEPEFGVVVAESHPRRTLQGLTVHVGLLAKYVMNHWSDLSKTLRECSLDVRLQPVNVLVSPQSKLKIGGHHQMAVTHFCLQMSSESAAWW